MKTKRRGVRDLGNGRYQLRLYVAGRDYVRTISAKSMREAEMIRLQVVEELRSRTAPELLSNAAAEWLRKKTTAKRPDGSTRLAPSTIDRYKRTVNGWIIPLLGEYEVTALTPAIIRDWRDATGEVLAAATVNSNIRVLRQLLADLGSEAAKRVSVLEEDDSRISEDEPNLLTRDELRRFLEVARRFEHRRSYAAVLFLVVSGARISTALATRWEDVDPEQGVIHLRRRLSKKEILPGVKRSRKSKDMVPLLPELHAALLEHRERMTEQQRASGFLFPSPQKEGAPLHRQTIVEVVEAIRIEAAILKRLTVHGLRRTAALHYRLAAGTTIARDVLGHMSESMHRHYAPEQAEERAQAAERAFGALLQ